MKYTVRLKEAKVVKISIGDREIGETYLFNEKFLDDLLSPYNRCVIDNFLALYDIPADIKELLERILEHDFEIFNTFFQFLSRNPSEVITIEIQDYPPTPF